MRWTEARAGRLVPTWIEATPRRDRDQVCTMALVERLGASPGRPQADLARALELRGVRVPRSLAVPVVEDAGRIAALLRGHAPIPHRKGAVLLPAPARDLEAALAIARDPEEADRRGLALGAQGQRMLPPVTLEPGQSAF